MTGELKVGELISFVNYLGQVLMSLMMLSMIIMSYARASASSKRILEVLDTQPSLTDTPEGMRSTREIEKGEIAFEKVSFRYGGRTAVNIAGKLPVRLRRIRGRWPVKPPQW